MGRVWEDEIRTPEESGKTGSVEGTTIHVMRGIVMALQRCGAKACRHPRAAEVSTEAVYFRTR